MDGEGCFTIWVTKNSRYKQGWLVQVSFQITLHKKDQELLKWIQIYLKGVGNITKQGKNYINYRVKNIEGLKLIIDHFDSYPLKTQKQGDFELFKLIFYLMLKKEHLTNEGLLKIVAIKASMNLGLSDYLKVAFPNIIPQERPLVETKTIDNPDWLAGFTSAEGCFMIKIKASQTITGYAVQLEFQVTQHMRDEQLIRSLIKYFECGNIQKNAENFDFRVTKITDITQKIIPFFQKHSNTPFSPLLCRPFSPLRIPPPPPPLTPIPPSRPWPWCWNWGPRRGEKGLRGEGKRGYPERGKGYPRCKGVRFFWFL